MQCIIDCLGPWKEEFRNITNRNDCYGKKHVIMSWILYNRVNKASILLKIKAGVCFVMTGETFHVGSLKDTLQKSFVL